MKKMVGVLLLLLVLLLTGCTSREDWKAAVIKIYHEHEQMFADAAAAGDYSAVEALLEGDNVYIGTDYVDIYFGGTGLVPSSSYYGVFYSAKGDMCVVYAGLALSELTAEGDGWCWRQPGGDNSYYVEPLGNGYYYYEEHY